MFSWVTSMKLVGVSEKPAEPGVIHHDGDKPRPSIIIARLDRLSGYGVNSLKWLSVWSQGRHVHGFCPLRCFWNVEKWMMNLDASCSAGFWIQVNVALL
jgi:hypothetical protein